MGVAAVGLVVDVAKVEAMVAMAEAEALVVAMVATAARDSRRQTRTLSTRAGRSCQRRVHSNQRMHGCAWSRARWREHSPPARRKAGMPCCCTCTARHPRTTLRMRARMKLCADESAARSTALSHHTSGSSLRSEVLPACGLFRKHGSRRVPAGKETSTTVVHYMKDKGVNYSSCYQLSKRATAHKHRSCYTA